MNNAVEILKAVWIDLDEAILLLNTDRGLQATEFCNDCASLLQNLASAIHLDISEAIFNAVPGYTSGARCSKLLDKLQFTGILTIREGDKYQAQSRFVEAKQLFESALAITKTTDRRREEAVAQGRLGIVCNILLDKQKAKEHHENALDIAIEIGDRQREGTGYGNLGLVFQSLSEYQKAKEYHEKALDIAKEVGNREGEEASYGNLGLVFQFLGDYRKAEGYFENAMTIAAELGDRKLGPRYLSLGTVFLHQGKGIQAMECLGKALDMSKTIGNRAVEANSMAALAALFARFNRYEKAKELCQKTLAISRVCGNRAEIYLCLVNIFRLHGECDKAECYLEKAHSISSKLGDKKPEYQSLLCITQLKVSESKNQEAEQYLFRCIEKYEKMSNFRKENREFQILLFDEHGIFTHKLLTKLLCDAGKFRDALYVEELGRARVLVEVLSENFSVEGLISADPKSWSWIERIVKKENSRSSFN